MEELLCDGPRNVWYTRETWAMSMISLINVVWLIGNVGYGTI